MTRNIVFDMGNVLVVFDPQRFMSNEGINDPGDRELVMKELFHNIEWAQMDLGVLTEETAEPLVMERIPDRLKEQAKHLLHHWWDRRDCIDGMEALLKDLREAGYRLFLLSNASVSQHIYWPTFEMSRLFDGKLISCDLGIVKPNPEIYRRFTAKFSLNPEECLFVDDLPANVAAAVSCGWKGIVFQGSADDLRRRLQQENIRIGHDHS